MSRTRRVQSEGEEEREEDEEEDQYVQKRVYISAMASSSLET